MSFFPWTGPNWKPKRGSLKAERDDRTADAVRLERREKDAVRRRDRSCRWPEAHECQCGLECAHMKDASLLGAMHRRNMYRLCGWLHRRGPESIHGKQIKAWPEDWTRGAEGPLSFWRQRLDGNYEMVARELRPYVLDELPTVRDVQPASYFKWPEVLVWPTTS